MQPRFASIIPALLLGVCLLLALRLGAAAEEDAQADALVPVLVELAEPPAVQIYAAAQQRGLRAQAVVAAQAQIQRIQQAQEEFLTRAPLAGAPLIYRTQRVYNGVALLLPQERVAQVRELPGVAAVHRLPLYTVDLVRTTPYLAAPQVWDMVYGAGFDGEAVSIGIIDTGIDYFHRDFGGPGVGYRQNDPTVITDVIQGFSFPSARVVGGYDFAGEEYDARPGGNPIPQPDPDPVDCWGHGTHVAGIAGGGGVLLKDGLAYTGPYTSGLDFSRFLVGPGVAPRARLYALKVFGCSGASNLVDVALEWAVDPNQDGDFSDRLDVVNLSVGSPYGAAESPTTVAMNNAALAGVVVVAAAGNSGDAYYIVSSPGTADRAVSVAASAITGLPLPEEKQGQVGSPATDSMTAFSARGPRRGDAALKPDIAAPGSSVRSAAMGSGYLATSLSGTSMATPQVAGGLALLRQLHPGWRVEELKALLLNTARYNLVANSAYPPLSYGPGRAGAGRMDLDGARRSQVIAYNGDDPGQVSISFGAPQVLGALRRLKNLRIVNKGDVTRTVFLTYTPVVDMPGVDISLLGDPMARLLPHNALNVAVLFSAQADALTNTADPTIAKRLNFPRHWVSEESGYIYAWPQPTEVEAVLAGSKMLPGVDTPLRGRFDGVLHPGDGALRYTLTFTSTGPFTVTAAALHVGPINGTGPALHELVAAPLTGTHTLSVTGVLTLSRQALNLLAADYLYVQAATKAHPEGAVRGQMTPREPVLRTPVYAGPSPASAMESAQASLHYGAAITGVQELTLVGQGLLSAASLSESHFPTDTISLLATAELLYSSPNEEQSPPYLDHADLKYVGVASDYPDHGQMDQTRLVFALVTHDDWSSPNEMQFRIYLDVDDDVAAEYVLRSDNVGDFLGTETTDEFFSVLEDVQAGTRQLAYFRNLVSSAELNTAVFNNNVALLAVDARDLGLTPERSSLRFWVSTTSMDTEEEGATVDATPVLAYDVARPGVWAQGGLGGLPLFYDLPGERIRVEADQRVYGDRGSQGLLLLHLHNESATRAQVVNIRWAWVHYLPWVAVSP